MGEGGAVVTEGQGSERVVGWWGSGGGEGKAAEGEAQWQGKGVRKEQWPSAGDWSMALSLEPLSQTALPYVTRKGLRPCPHLKPIWFASKRNEKEILPDHPHPIGAAGEHGSAYAWM